MSSVLRIMRMFLRSLVSLGMTIGLISAIATAILFAANITITDAQRLPGQHPIIQTRTFQNTKDGFRLKVPDGWIVHDFNNTKSGWVYAERELGIGILAQICPQKEALPGIRVVYNCKQSDTNVYVIRYLNLGDKPELADIGNPGNIISDDFLTFLIGKLQDGNYSNIKVGSSSDIRINVTSPDNPDTTIKWCQPSKWK